MGRLILYDLTILRRSAAAAFGRKRDILLLLLIIPIGLLIAAARAGEAASFLGSLPIIVRIVAVAAIALAVNIAVGSRLTHLREESMVARQALRPASAFAHILFWNLPSLAATLGLALISPEGGTAGPALFLAYLAGAGLAAGQKVVRERAGWWLTRRRYAAPGRRREPKGATRQRRTIALLAGRTGLFGPALAANLLGFAVIGALLAAGHAWLAAQLTGHAAAVITGVPLLLLLLTLLRAQPSLLRHLLYLGTAPAMPALVATATAGALIGSLIIVAFVTAAAPALAPLAGGLAILLLFLALALLRDLHFATRPRQQAELALQVDLIAAALAGFVALPLAPAVLVARLWQLTVRARAMKQLAL